MHCSRCRSPMFQTHQESGNLSRQQWFRCPTCARTAMTSAPVATGETRLPPPSGRPPAALRLSFG